MQEIADISKLLATRNNRRQNVADGEPENVVLIGDFNIFNKAGDKTSAALEKNDFIVPDPLRSLEGSNLSRDKYFDQIAFHDPQKLLRSTEAGIFNFSTVLYKDDEADLHREAMEWSAPEQFKKAKDKQKFYKNWRTFQVSDHLPLWIELQTDFANNYLGSIYNRKKTGTAKGPKEPPTGNGIKIKAPPM